MILGLPIFAAFWYLNTLEN